LDIAKILQNYAFFVDYITFSTLNQGKSAGKREYRAQFLDF